MNPEISTAAVARTADRAVESPVTSRDEASWLRALVEDAPFLLTVLVYTLAAIVLSAAIDVPADFTLGLSLQLWYVVGVSTALFGVTFLLALLVHEVRAGSGGLRSKETWRRVLRRTFPAYQTRNYLFIFLALPFLARTFLAFKSSISGVQPFGPWDVRFMELDRILHFGVHPYVLLQPLLGHPVVTYAIDFVYYLWFPVLWMTVTWQAWHGSRRTATRSQFLLSFALGWVLLGTVAAMALSSAGPVYYPEVTGAPDVYRGLMGHLESVNETFPLKALWTQDVLWTSYVEGRLASIGGISAMPSLHVAMATLLALFGLRVNRWAAWAYVTFAVLIFLGSVHLGWHYAVDGYLGAGAMWGIWWASGRITAWWREAGPFADRLSHEDPRAPEAVAP